MKESAIEKDFCKKALKLGIQNIKLGQTGWPDRMFLFPGGKVAFVEFKTLSGRLSKVQEERLNELTRLGFPGFVIRDSDLLGVRAFAYSVDPENFKYGA